MGFTRSWAIVHLHIHEVCCEDNQYLSHTSLETYCKHDFLKYTMHQAFEAEPGVQ